jgi:hypothetical protein
MFAASIIRAMGKPRVLLIALMMEAGSTPETTLQKTVICIHNYTYDKISLSFVDF